MALSNYIAGSEDTPARVLPDGRGLWIVPLTFHRARLIVGVVGAGVYDDAW